MIVRCIHLCNRCGVVMVNHQPPTGVCQLKKDMTCMVCIKKRR